MTESADLDDYRELLTVSLSSARDTAAKCIRKAQRRYKVQYDRRATPSSYRVGEWILIRFPHEESGRLRKLSRPWHGPYRVVENREADIVAVKVYFPEEKQIQVHQSRVCRCSCRFPAGYYWYGGNRRGPGRPPHWVQQLLESGPRESSTGENSSPTQDSHATRQAPPHVKDRGSDESDDEDSEDSEDEESTQSELMQAGDSSQTNADGNLAQRDNPRYSLRQRINPPSRFKD